MFYGSYGCMKLLCALHQWKFRKIKLLGEELKYIIKCRTFSVEQQTEEKRVKERSRSRDQHSVKGNAEEYWIPECEFCRCIALGASRRGGKYHPLKPE